MWLAPASELEIDLAANQDDSVISHFLVEYRATFLQLLMFAFNYAIVTLKVLNYFSLAKYHTPRLLTWDLSGIPLWQKCLSDLKGVSPQVRAHLRSMKPNPPLRPTPLKQSS